MAQVIETKEFVGVKKIKGEKEIAASQKEALLQKELNSLPSIMSLLDSIETTGSEGQPVLYQFMPLAGFGNGDFLKYLLSKTDQSTREKILSHILFSLLTGLKNMHDRHIYHLDLKPSNFVLSPMGNLWIIDFGCAIKSATAFISPTNGDTRYFSPERLACYKDSGTFDAAKADIWALGVTMLELIIGKYPFNTTLNFEQRIQYWNKQYFNETLSIYLSKAEPGSLLEVIGKLVEADSTTRLSAAQALSEPLFKKKGAEEQATLFSGLKSLETRDAFAETALISKDSNPNYVNNYTTHPKEEVKSNQHSYSNVPKTSLSSQAWGSDYENAQQVKQKENGSGLLLQFGREALPSRSENINSSNQYEEKSKELKNFN